MSDLTELEGYQIVEKIGSGGIATVYKAFSPDKGAVAIKVLLSQEPEDIERFKREFLLLSGIKHPHIVQVYDLGYTPKALPFFSMELIEGKEFKTFVPEFDPQKLYSVILQTCLTLEFLHLKGIIHGDIKPSNILISLDKKDNPRVKFTDFGIAQYGKTFDFSQWRGTIPYLAPEIIRGDEYNYQVDLYSLGVMLYQVLTGSLPFEESDVMSIAMDHLEREVKFPPDSRIPEALRQIVLKLLKKDPLDRYFSAREVIEEIKSVSPSELKDDDLTLAWSLIASANFVGRDEELSGLKHLFEEAKLGRTEIVLLQGEQGMGKRKFLKEFKGLVQSYGGTVIRKTILDAGENLLSELQELLKRPGPLVLVIEDSQKLETELLDSLAVFLKKKEKALILLALNNNLTLPEEEGKINRIESILKSSLENLLTRIDLKPLKKEDSGKMISSMFRWKGKGERINQAVYRKTGGDPALIVYLMNSSLEQGLLKRIDSGWNFELSGLDQLPPPEEYKKRITGRLGQLSAENLNLLEAASILGEEFEAGILSELTGRDEKAISAFLSLLFKESLLKKDSSSGESKISFVNGMLRDLIYGNIEGSKRKKLHAKCGRVLEKLYSANMESVLGDLAYHFIQAGAEEPGFRYSLLAGEKAEKENDCQEAIRNYKNALKLHRQWLEKPTIPEEEILSKLGSQYGITGSFDEALTCYAEAINRRRSEGKSPDRIAKLCQETGVIYLRKGDYESAIGILQEGLSLDSKVQSAIITAELNITLGWVYQRKRDYSQAISYFQKSIETLKKRVSKELGLAYNGLGVVYWELGEFNKALNSYHKSMAILEELKDEKCIATVNMNLGLLARNKGNPKEALNYFEKALPFEEKHGNIASLSFLYNNLALAYENLYEWDRSLEYHQKSCELKVKMDDQNGLAVTFSNLGLVHLRRGSLNKSVENYSRALRLFHSLKDRQGVADCSSSLGEVYLLHEDWSRAETHLERSLRIRDELSGKPRIAETLRLLGRLNLERGDFSPAFAQLKKSLKLFDALGNQNGMLDVSLSLAELGLRQNNTTEAEIHLSYAEKLFDSVDDESSKGKFHKVKGFLFLKKNNTEQSLKELLEAVYVFRKLKMRYELGLTYLEVGKIKLKQNSLKEARGYLRESLNIFRGMGIIPKASECEKHLQGICHLSQADQQRTQVLYQISELLNNLTDQDELLVRILDLAIEHLSAERAAVILYYPEDDSLELKTVRGIEVETKEDALSISRRVIKDVLITNEPLIIEDAKNDPETSLYQSVITHNILSILCVPLTTGQKTLGTIYVDHRSLAGMFSREDSDFLKAFANLVAVALEKAQLYNQLNEEIFQLKNDIRQTYSYPNIVGKSKKMQEVFNMVEKVANSKTSVLLLGESGTGKELIANLIHHSSIRKDNPFVKVNCAALPESLLESELFGVEEKVATGVAMRDGKFKQADKGTIFFDEIGDMSLSTQAKVLRVLQEREFERVGGSRIIKVDIRVISATNKDLEECIRNNLFRKDLFYRLNPVTIKIPPLRERKEDIPYIVDFFLEKFSGESKKSKIKIPVKIMNLLMDYPWPGNVRELANLIERAVLFSENGFFPKDYLPTKTQIQKEKKLLTSHQNLKHVLDHIEKEMILQALEKNNWNQVKTASQLGIGEATLRRKMAKHKIKKFKGSNRRK